MGGYDGLTVPDPDNPNGSITPYNPGWVQYLLYSGRVLITKEGRAVWNEWESNKFLGMV